MKAYVHSLVPQTILLVVALAAPALVSSAASGKTNATASATPPAAPVVVEIPKSEFVMPASPNEGRDPFFPRSTRPFASPVVPVAIVKTNVPKPTVLEEVACNGISGTTEKPLAIINNRTFEVGEENEITSGGRSVRIRCLEINRTNGTVLIQAGGERRELRLQPRK